jgi:TQXA domain-containing protein/LPXTG-motif cell wall-anchored protein
MANRFHPGRIGAAVLGASIALMAAAPRAFAAPTAPADGTSSVTATPIRPNPGAQGVNVELKNDKQQTTPEETALIGLKVDGVKDPVFTYCIGLTRDLNGQTMHEVDWDKYPNESVDFSKNKTKINWVLHNSYPTTSLADLGKAAGIQNLAQDVAIGATQAAVWHYSDGVDLIGAKNTDPSHPYSQKVVQDTDKLYHFLTDNNPGLDQPKPTLNINSKDAKQNGDLVGPFVVASTATGELKLDTSKLPKGVTLSDAKGNAITSVKDGDSVFLKVADGTPSGSATFGISTEATLELGRIFIGVDDTPKKCSGDLTQEQKKHECPQELIVAQASKVTVSAQATGSWTLTTTSSTTPPPTTTTTTTQPTTTTTTATCVTATTSNTNGGGGDTPMPPTCNTPTTNADTSPLAYTGASVIGPIIAGLVLIGAGVGALFFVRRRKAKHTA